MGGGGGGGAPSNQAQKDDNSAHMQYIPFIQAVAPQNPGQIRPKKLNQKEFLKLIDEVYSYRFENKLAIQTTGTGTNSSRGAKQLPDRKDQKKSKKEQELTGKDLQEVAALYLGQKFPRKTQVDQLAADFINSIEYHR